MNLLLFYFRERRGEIDYFLKSLKLLIYGLKLLVMAWFYKYKKKKIPEIPAFTLGKKL